MSTTIKSHLTKEAVIGGVSNAFFNGWIAWLLLRGGPDLSWSGEHSFIPDIVATAFLLPLIVALIVIPLQRRKLRKGALPIIDIAPDTWLRAFISSFPKRLFGAALLFGLLGVICFAPLALLGIYVGSVTTFSPMGYAIFKGVWAGVMAAVLMVPMVLLALRPPAETEVPAS